MEAARLLRVFVAAAAAAAFFAAAGGFQGVKVRQQYEIRQGKGCL
jgi:hypothetical protein